MFDFCRFQTIVLCIPCFTYTDVRLSVTSMKSILMHTNATISVHFITTATVKHSLETLYTSWDLKNGKCTLVIY